jgi:hypothetical protein
VEYLVIAGMMVVMAVIALVFILGSRAMAQSRSENGEPDDR